MNTSNGPVRPLPTATAPDDTVCLQIDVPADPQWIGAFYDNLLQLTYWFAWDRDDAHTGRLIARRWLQALDTLRTCDDQTPIKELFEELDIDMTICEQLRFHDGKLQGLCCGDWTDIPGQADQGIGGPDQPGSGARQPIAGGDPECYHGKLNASQVWLMPTVVNAGDVITFENISGAGSDGTLHWYCPTGSIFFAGACVGSLSTSGSDPAPALHHMAILAKIGSVYYDITLGPITVPGGIVNEQVFVQVNDVTLAGNSGDYVFDVCVANNATPTWVSVLDFTLNSYSGIRSGGYGVWTAGTGLVGEAVGGSGASVVQPWLDMDAFTLTGYSMLYDVASLGGAGESVGVYQVGAASGYVKALVTPGTGTNQTDATTATCLAVTELQPTLNSGTTGGAAVLKKLTVYGSGPKPSQLP